MRAGVAFDEDCTASDGVMIEFRVEVGWNPGEREDDLRSFINRPVIARFPIGEPRRPSGCRAAINLR